MKTGRLTTKMNFKYCLEAPERFPQQFILESEHRLTDMEIGDWAKMNKVNHVRKITNLATMIDMNKRNMASAMYEDTMMSKKIVWSTEENEIYGKIGGFAIFKIVRNANATYDRFRVSCIHEIAYDANGIFRPSRLVYVQDLVEQNVSFGEMNELIETLSKYDVEVDETVYWKVYQLWKDKKNEEQHNEKVQNEIERIKHQVR